MGNPIEKSLDNMADIAKLIMEKAVERGELSKADITILAMYQKEKARATSVPIHKKVIGAVKEISTIINGFSSTSNDTQNNNIMQKPEIDNNNSKGGSK